MKDEEKVNPLTVSCPKCKAKKTRMCVYLWPKDVNGDPVNRRTWQAEGIIALMDRVGKPCKRAHGERFAKARLKLKVDELNEAERRMKESWDPRGEILKANAQGLMRETDDLISWLRRHAHILLNAGKEADNVGA